MIGQKRLLNKEFSQFTILYGKKGSGKKTLIHEKYDEIAGIFNTVEEVRWVIEDSNKLSNPRYYLFDRPTLNAQRALLKITEEPNPFTNIIVICSYTTYIIEPLYSRANIEEMDNYTEEQLKRFGDSKYYDTPGLLIDYEDKHIKLAKQITNIETLDDVFTIADEIDELYLVTKPLKHMVSSSVISLIHEYERYDDNNYNFTAEEMLLQIWRGING